MSERASTQTATAVDSYAIELPFGTMSAYDTMSERYLSDLAGYFADEAAYAEMVNDEDRLLYRVYGTMRPAQPGDLISGITLIRPGKVGDEYFMTKGHYHAVLETGEVYYCLRGSGMLVMERPEGESRVEEFGAGRVIQIPPRWAHRTVNVGEDDLLFFWVCPANAGHDYGTIVERGFRQRVVARAGEVVVIENL